MPPVNQNRAPERIVVTTPDSIDFAIDRAEILIGRGREVMAFVETRGAKALGFRILLGDHGYQVISPNPRLSNPASVMGRTLSKARQSLVEVFETCSKG